MLFTPIKGCLPNANHKQTIEDIIRNKPVSSRLFKVFVDYKLQEVLPQKGIFMIFSDTVDWQFHS